MTVNPPQAAGQSTRKTQAYAFVLLVAAMSSVQVGASLAKQLFPVIGTYGVTLARLALSAVILCLIRRPWRHTLTGSDRHWIILYGIVLGVMNLTFYLALARIPLGIAVALEFTGPLAVALWGSRRWHDVAWVALAGAGFLGLLPNGARGGVLDPIGMALALFAGVCWGLYIILGQRAGSNVPSGVATSLGILTATFVVLPFCLVGLNPFTLTTSLVWLLIAMAVLSSVVPFSLEMVALQRLPTKTFGILMSLEPAIAALSGLVILHEHLRLTQWSGIMLVIMASVGSVATATTPMPVVDTFQGQHAETFRG